MTISTRRSSIGSIRTMPTATLCVLAFALCAVAPPRLLAGFGKPSPIRSPYPVVADIDRDGQAGGTPNPSVLDQVDLQRPAPEGLILASFFFGDGSVSKLEKQAAGFTPIPEIAVFTPDPTTDALTDDLDCDGDEDLLVANFEILSCILQQPGSTFAAPTPCAQISGSPFGENCVKVTDLTGDQCPDIVSVSNTFQSPNNGLIQVFPNNGGGVFLPPTTITVPGATIAANAVGDIDGDGADEVALIRGTSTVSILRRTAPSTLTPLNASTGLPLAPTDDFSLSAITFPAGLFEVALKDVNNDGNADILASNLNDIFIRTSNANGTFNPFITLDGDSGTRNVAVADFNADGTDEVFATNPNNDVVNLWRSTGPLQWATKVGLPVGTSPSGVLATDTNDDGLLDILALNRIDGDAVIYLNNGAGDFILPQRFAYSFPVQGGYTSVAPGDFDGDGHTDIFASTQRGDMDLFLNRADGSGLLEERINDRISANPFFAVTLPAPAGLPGDGRDRVGIGVLNNDDIAVFQYDATAPITQPFVLQQLFQTPGNLITSITTCDVNADSITDIAVTLAGSTPAAQVFLGDSAGLFGNPIALNLAIAGWDQFLAPLPTSGLPANRFYIGDYQTGNVLPLDFAAGAFTAGSPIGFGTNCTDFALGDIDGDGVDDLAAARTGAVTGSLVVRTNITAPTIPAATSLPIQRNPAGIAVGDINGDGRNDVVVSTAGPVGQNQYVISILNSGTGLDPATATLHPAGERPARPLLVDLHDISTTRGAASLAGPEVVIPNRDATGFQFNASVQVLPNMIDFAPPSPACVADINDDGVVNTSDLTLFLVRFGQSAAPGSPAAAADLNGDGTVNTTDLTLLLVRFGQTCS